MTDKQDRKKNRDRYPEVVFSRQLLTTEQLASVGCVAIESTYLEAELEELLCVDCRRKLTRLEQ